MKSLLTTIAVFAQVYLLMPLAAKAETTTSGVYSGLDTSTVNTIAGTGATGTSLTTVIGNGINVLLGLLGIVFLVLVVYAGFLYLTDQGAGEKAKKAMKLLTTAVIGIVIIVAAYAISNYVIGAMVAVVE